MHRIDRGLFAFRFSWHRLLRIMPGFWVCLLVVALIVAPMVALLQGLPVSTPFVETPTVFHFLAANAGLTLIDNRDLTPYLALQSRWDRFIALCVRSGRWLPSSTTRARAGASSTS